jgi:calcineurin-like phosphoesterase family protein
MTTWYTADLHFGHTNITAYAGRPPRHVEEMNLAIVETFNSLIRPDDELVVLGDVALGTIAHSLSYVGLLHGRLSLVPGNHDRCWPGHGQKAENWKARYLEAGFAEILDPPAHRIINGTRVELSHFPYRNDAAPQERFTEHRPINRGNWLLHGHVHQLWKQQGRMINVGIDAWGGRPVSEQEVIALMRSSLQTLPREPWPGGSEPSRPFEL